METDIKGMLTTFAFQHYPCDVFLKKNFNSAKIAWCVLTNEDIRR